jgi:hypothetical protein
MDKITLVILAILTFIIMFGYLISLTFECIQYRDTPISSMPTKCISIYITK